MANDTFDFIIAGGGNAGCVLASRLSQYFPECSVAVVEAGPDARDDELITDPANVVKLHGSDLEWNYETVPQKSINDRKIYCCTGKLLSGSSGVNYGMWTRGHKVDYDRWSETVGDGKWNYEKLLPCFKRSETHPTGDSIDENHGYEGPIRTGIQPVLPLRETLREAFQEVGIPYNPDTNSGNSLGFGIVSDNWYNDVRKPAGAAYDLSRVTILVNSPIAKIIIEPGQSGPVAKGIELVDGKSLYAKKEVIVSCGAFRTPQLLMLSGIGPVSHLDSLGIKSKVDLPEVGQNFHDHPAALLYWLLAHPERGLANGSVAFKFKGRPREWMYCDNVPAEKLASALAKDHPQSDISTHPNLVNPSAHFETIISYDSVGGNFMKYPPPVDGSVITMSCGVFQTTSRGSVTLSSSNPMDAPVIDPRYLSTDHDLCIMREAVRQSIRVLSTAAAKEEFKEIFTTPDATPLSLDTSDEELNEYFRNCMITFFHPAGTAAMGTVVDSSCRVKGVDGLRVVDTSIFPEPLAAHYQSPVYAIAERAAEIIKEEL